MKGRNTPLGIRKCALSVVKNITIEPMLFMRQFALSFVAIKYEDMKLERFCRVRLGHSEEECALMNDGNHEDLQIEVQKLDNRFIFYEKIISIAIPVVLLAFIASWSDSRGRRIPLCASLLGEVLNAGVYCLEALFPSWPPEVLLAASFLKSLGGGYTLFYMAAYSYMADKSSRESRMFRLAVMNAVGHLGGPAGTVLGPLTYNSGGYTAVFAVSTGIYTLCLIYTLIVVKDHQKQMGWQDFSQVQKISPWNPKNVVDLFRVCLRKRPGRDRAHIILLTCMMMSVFSSITDNMYLWAMRVLNWDDEKYSVYRGSCQLIRQVVMLVVALVVRELRVHDCLVGAGVTLLNLTQMLALGMVTSPSQWWVPYAFVFVPEQLVSPAIRSLMSKSCHGHEVGRVFSMLAILEVFWPILNSAMYTAIYGATIEYYPSFEHLVSAYFSFFLLCGFLGVRLSLGSVQLKELSAKASTSVVTT